MISAIAASKKISWYSVGIKQQMKYQGIVTMIANLFNQFNKFLGLNESNSAQNHPTSFNQIALKLSILVYSLILIYMFSLLYVDIPDSNPLEPETNKSLIER